MGRYLYILVLSLLLANGLAGQTPTPTPVPSQDAQALKPENAVKDIPAVAPGYRSSDRALPDVSRVGVDAVDQLPLTLRDALERALTNNRDIEISRKTE